MNAAGSPALVSSPSSAAGSSAVLPASSSSSGSVISTRVSSTGGSSLPAISVRPSASPAPPLFSSFSSAPLHSTSGIGPTDSHVLQSSARPVPGKQRLSVSQGSDKHRPSQPLAVPGTSDASEPSHAASTPDYIPLILASDDADAAMPPPEAHEKRQVGGVSMGIGVLVGALAVALIVLGFFLYRRIRRRREDQWRRRRLTHVDPGSHVGEHVDGEKIPVSPFLAGSSQWTRGRVLHISSENFLEFDEEVGVGQAEEVRTPRSGDANTPRTADPLLRAASASSPAPSSSTLLVPAQTSPGPGSAQTSGSMGSRGRARTPPAALALTDAAPASAGNAARQSHDGAVEFTLHPPSSNTPSTSSNANANANAPRRSSIEKRPERRLVAHNALTPPPPTTPLRTPAPRYSRGLWGRLSGVRQSVIPPAYESPKPDRTTHGGAHLAVPEASRVQWAPLRVEEPSPAPHPFAARTI